MFDLEILYKKGTANADADSMSRMPQEPDEDENVVEDETIMINYIIATNNPLNHEQQADPNLAWIYNLKIQAISENKDRIVVTDFENQEQRSLYKQWHRIQIINDRLYRAWTFEKRNKQCVVFQYIVPRNQRLEKHQQLAKWNSYCHLIAQLEAVHHHQYILSNAIYAKSIRTEKLLLVR